LSDLAPGLLIAVPQMDDPNFARSVVLLIEHNESGAMGITFNRPSDVLLADIGKEHGMDVHPGAGSAFIGGPVQRERGFLVHRRGDLGDSVELLDEVYLSVSTDALRTSTDTSRASSSTSQWRRKKPASPSRSISASSSSSLARAFRLCPLRPE